MNTMSDNIRAKEKYDNFASMSGNIELNNCKGDVETMSGNIYLMKHYGDSVHSMSGDVFIQDSAINYIETMSGDITVHGAQIRGITSLSGDITIHKVTCNTIHCAELFGEESTIMTLFIQDNSPYIENIKNSNTKFKWWNPFTWFESNVTQTIKCGNNSTCFQSNGDTYIVSGKKIYRDGKCITKSAKPRTFILPDTIKVDKVIFDNGRTDNILKARHKTVVENGTWQKV